MPLDKFEQFKFWAWTNTIFPGAKYHGDSVTWNTGCSAVDKSNFQSFEFHYTDSLIDGKGDATFTLDLDDLLVDS